ncbi:MAG: GNAT family N-acetyltransferase [Chloroflexota bacterium]
MAERYHFHPIREDEAREIHSWRYPPPYDFYNGSGDEADLTEYLSTDSPYFAAVLNGALAGFLAVGPTARMPGGEEAGVYIDPAALDIGLGLRPDLTGQGYGLPFTRTALVCVSERFGPPIFRLSVVAWNQRAITVYERAGFIRGMVFASALDGQPFLCMTRPAG